MTLKDEVLFTMDPTGIIGQPGYPESHNGGIDGGDAINRMAHYRFGIEANKKVGDNIGFTERLPRRFSVLHEIDLRKFECKTKGVYRRHHDENHPYNAGYCNGVYDGNQSRDQETPNVIAMGAFKMYDRVLMLALRYAQRGFIFCNNVRKNGTGGPYKYPTSLKTIGISIIRLFKKDYKTDFDWKFPDPVAFEFWACVFRCFPVFRVVMNPILHLMDLETLVGSLIWKFYRLKKITDENGVTRFRNDDIINHVIVCTNGMQTSPTLTMYLACKLLPQELVIEALEEYWSGWRMSPYFVDIYEPIVKKYFKS
jgi:hypothetical protein